MFAFAGKLLGRGEGGFSLGGVKKKKNHTIPFLNNSINSCTDFDLNGGTYVKINCHDYVLKDVRKPCHYSSHSAAFIIRSSVMGVTCYFAETAIVMAMNCHKILPLFATICTLTVILLLSSSAQLQKNCLLSLCSDRILQEVPFNRSVYKANSSASPVPLVPV